MSQDMAKQSKKKPAATAPPVQPFDVSREYQALLDVVRSGKASGTKKVPVGLGGAAGVSDDVYQSLMARERRVLDTVDRVVNDARQRNEDTRPLHQLPLHELCMRTMASLQGLAEELAVARTPQAVMLAFKMPPERRTFLGVALVVVGGMLVLLSSAEG